MDASDMAKHISLGGPKTDFAKMTQAIRKDVDPKSVTAFWMDRIDAMDPELGQDLTSEFMDTEKTRIQIKRLEEKIAAEKGDWTKLSEIQADEMLLKNYNQQLLEDSQQTVTLPEVAYNNDNESAGIEK